MFVLSLGFLLGIVVVLVRVVEVDGLVCGL